MQTQHGSVESSNLDGTSIASILTWDAKITTVLAMLGGTSQLMKEYLTQDALLDRFTQLITEFYETEFGKDPLPGNGEPFAMPSTKLPSGARPESWSCACAPTTLFSWGVVRIGSAAVQLRRRCKQPAFFFARLLCAYSLFCRHDAAAGHERQQTWWATLWNRRDGRLDFSVNRSARWCHGGTEHRPLHAGAYQCIEAHVFACSSVVF